MYPVDQVNASARTVSLSASTPLTISPTKQASLTLEPAALSLWATLLVHEDQRAAIPLVGERYPDFSTTRGHPDI